MYKNKKHIVRTFKLILSAFICISLVFSIAITSKADTPSPVSVTGRIFHAHTGSPDSGGGCYSIHRSDTRTIEEQCPGTMVYWPEWDATQCDTCGAGYPGDQSHRRCWYVTTREESYDYYDLGCNMSEYTVLGNYTVTASENGWCQSTDLIMTLSNPAYGSGATPFSVNGTAAEGNTYTVNSSGAYTVRLRSVGGTRAEAVTVNVANVDVTGPVIRTAVLSPENWTNGDVTVSITDVIDLQPSGSEGCGLHELPFSYDGGETWTNETSHTYPENSNYTILVRDNLSNVASKNITVSNIDRTAPIISSITYDDTPDIETTLITVIVNDTQPDGTPGAGLPTEPYSYDGGETWTDDNTHEVTENGTVDVCVRDIFDNIVTEEVTVDNLDSYGPVVAYSLNPWGETEDKVTITWKATDIGAYESEGAGLPPDCFSYDNGRTWTERNTITVSSNGPVTVLVRDLFDNITESRCEVNNIVSPKDNNDGDDDDSSYVPLKPTITPTPAVTFPAKRRLRTSGTKPSETVKTQVSPAVVTSKAVPTNNATQKKIDTQELMSGPTEEVANRIDDKFSVTDILLTVFGTLAAISVLSGIVLLFLRTVAVYNYIGKLEYRLKGMSVIHYRNDSYEIDIPDRIFDSCDTGRLKLNFPFFFTKMHPDEQIKVYMPDKQNFIVSPGKDIVITLKEKH
ncbi:MAG: hypothetical protein K6G69_03425 [Lachnospiraceae bacterium]|nr:hypothetical protein [Lachnospiraceae bacterium]